VARSHAGTEKEGTGRKFRFPRARHFRNFRGATHSPSASQVPSRVWLPMSAGDGRMLIVGVVIHHPSWHYHLQSDHSGPDDT
jgi:hypothetical protein